MMENQSQPDSLLSSFPSWISIHGDAEYALYKEVESPPWLTYEEWAASEHPLGPYLYHLTLDAWDEVSSSVSKDNPVESRIVDFDFFRTMRVIRTLCMAGRIPCRTKQQ
ncbi:hypothetical protein BU24DRAFT_171171 [Aaosphaeria arxii CBS 175.79]|uniref:Uncharacterized protein n=1 Tax=Aaosphaeria arxii CBS 175.79 TaxID=1450172 RepID=A0A6A5XYR8_9PLEO|nr:uncharacterized protein BU24DRAFT_171171 [Aaosphaeria arxii CBS 175.79]KAF2018448.1 hypothetical protein BU24DRAFT_171171 [Aaosphaeria arxii CBS 175.79]